MTNIYSLFIKQELTFFRQIVMIFYNMFFLMYPFALRILVESQINMKITKIHLKLSVSIYLKTRKRWKASNYFLYYLLLLLVVFLKNVIKFYDTHTFRFDSKTMRYREYLQVFFILNFIWMVLNNKPRLTDIPV